jgi:hypothetical protein
MSNTNIKPQFVIKSAILTKDNPNFNKRSLEIDLTNSVLELSIFESLDIPYLSGNMTVLDNDGIFSDMAFQGTERIEFVLGTGDTENTTAILNKRFILTGIQRKVKTNESGNASVFTFTLIDEHGFLGRVSKISKSYDGSLERIVKNILQNELGRQVDIAYTGALTEFDEQSAQQDIKCIIPNLTPIDAIKWLTSRITTDIGSPYFVYSTLVLPDLSGGGDENKNVEDNEQGNVIRLGNLDTMLQQKPFNILPFRFSPNNTSNNLEPVARQMIIKNMQIGKSSNTLELMEKGAVMSEYTNTDLGTGEMFTTKHTLSKQLRDLSTSDIIETEQDLAQDIIDIGFTLRDLSSDAYNAKKYHTITSMGTYGNKKGYHDEVDENKFNLKVASRAIFLAMKKHPLTITVEGVSVIVGRAKVGDIVSLEIIGDNSNATIQNESPLDSRYSGNYLIYNMRHVFAVGSHNVVMDVCKLEARVI